MKGFNPFQLLPILLAGQIILGLSMGGPSQVYFPGSDVSVNVEVADTPEERKKGLMFRENLPIDRGMLFVFHREDERGFWMKNTLIQLDMIFIDSQGEIINIEEAYPEPNTSDENLKTYRSEGEARYVLETNSSFTEKYEIGDGDRVDVPTRFR